MRIKRLIGLVLAAGLVVLGCSTTKEVISWHEATYREIAKFVSGVTPFRGNPDSHYLIACYYQDQGNDRKAIEEFKKTLSYDPNYLKAYNALGISYDLLGDFSHAIESYKTALKINSGTDYIHNNLGYSYLLQEKVGDAIEAFKNAIRLNNQDERFHNNFGLAYAMNAQLDLAFEEFKLAGGETKAYYQLAQFCQKKGLPYLAKEYKDKALATTPSSTQPQIEPVVASIVQPIEKEEPMIVVEQPLPKIEVTPKYPEEMAMPQVKLPEQKNSPSMKEIGIEISNGNGVNQMAKKVGEYLKEMEMKVVRLANANNFNYSKTKIFYENGYHEEAEYVSKQLLAGIDNMEELKKLDRPNIRVKVLIGKDLIQYKEVIERGKSPAEPLKIVSTFSEAKK